MGHAGLEFSPCLNKPLTQLVLISRVLTPVYTLLHHVPDAMNKFVLCELIWQQMRTLKTTDLSGLLRITWLQFASEADQFPTVYYFLRIPCIPKVIKIGWFSTVIQRIKGRIFGRNVQALEW